MTRWEAELDRYLTTQPEARYMCDCEECNCELREGDDVVRIDGRVYCWDCIRDMRETLGE